MKASGWTALKWALVVPVFAASTVAAGVLALFRTWRVEHGALMWAAALHFDVASSLILRPVLLFFILTIALIWVLPPAFAVGYALRVRPLQSLLWGCSFALMLVAIFDWGRASSDTSIYSKWLVAAAVVMLAGGLALVFRSKRRAWVHSWVNAAVLIALFLPDAGASVFSPKQPPLATRVWSSVLQKIAAWDINTGSDYGATRHVVFAGDRVVAAYDAGSAGTEGNQPLSRFRVASLDAATGAVKNSIEFIGPWGSAPYLYATVDGHVRVEGGPVRVLNSDLSPAEAQDASSHGGADEASGAEGKIAVHAADLKQAGTAAGVSRDGSRFALQLSEQVGDPGTPLYETFIIYDAKSRKPVARVSMSDLPEKQSWSAFSDDGKLFAAGSPNRLNVYQIP